MKLTRSMKKQIKEERDRTFIAMSSEGISQEEWEALQEKYKAYNEMLKPSLSISPDTILIVAGNLAGIILILGYEKMDIITSKALNFVLKGRV